MIKIKIKCAINRKYLNAYLINNLNYNIYAKKYVTIQLKSKYYCE